MRTDKITRRFMGCGWESPLEGAIAPLPVGFSSDGSVNVCPGYLTQLPVVLETARAHAHWERGTLRDRYNRSVLSGHLLDALEYLQGSLWELESHQVAQAKEGAR